MGERIWPATPLERGASWRTSSRDVRASDSSTSAPSSGMSGHPRDTKPVVTTPPRRLALGLVLLLVSVAGCGGDGALPPVLGRARSAAPNAHLKKRDPSLFAPHAPGVLGGAPPLPPTPAPPVTR